VRLRRATFKTGAISVALCAGLAGNPATAPPNPQAVADPSQWPAQPAPIEVDASIEQRSDALLAAMSLEQKVGQIIQADIG